jgi:hypothetical protein
MNKALKKTMVILGIFWSLAIYSQTNQVKIDQFQFDAPIEMGTHANDVAQLLSNQKDLWIIKGSIYPHKEYTDSNLFATIYIQPGKDDPTRTMGAEYHIGLSFYRNRLFHVNYFFQVPDDTSLQQIQSILRNEMGCPTDSFGYEAEPGKYDFHELSKSDTKYQWVGEHCNVELLFTNEAGKYTVEIVKVNKPAFENYILDMKLVDQQRKKMKMEDDKKVLNTRKMILRDLAKFIKIVRNYRHYTSVEKLLSSYSRTGVLHYKRFHDQDGVYWGFKDLDNKSYYIYYYNLLSKPQLEETKFDYFKEVAVYCDMNHDVIQIRVEFAHPPKLKDLQDLIDDEETIELQHSEKLVGYNDIMGSAVISLFPDENGQIAGINICKQNLQCLVHMD